jgi:hypothetical protein
MCGACCVAPDIAALDKPLGRRCEHLAEDLSCRVYATRPLVCRQYEADAMCDAIDAPTLAARVQRYLALFGLEQEAAREAGRTSRSARRYLPMFALRRSG